MSGLNQASQTPSCPFLSIPGAYVLLDRIPINPVSGKVDIRALKSPKQIQAISPDHIALKNPKDPDEQHAVMRKLWEAVLKLSSGTITNQDNFFEYGGHSLLAVQLIPMIKRIYNTQILVKDIYEHPTILQLIDFINKGPDKMSKPVSIQSDVYLDSSIQATQVDSITPIYQAKKVFVTGTTGYLGVFLLEELLRRFPEIKVYCLTRTRQKDTQLAMQRIRNNLEAYHLYTPEMEDRIVPIVGDLTLPNLGLSKS
jgi:Putative dehydrogenase domain of multifunctional non-ribosomal peptide synthetases and related enzymes